MLKPHVSFVAEFSLRYTLLARKLTGLNWNYAFLGGEDVFKAVNEYAISNEVDLFDVIP